VLLFTVFKLALMFVLPPATAVAAPDELIVATAGIEDVQTAIPDRSSVLLSLYVPAAVNCWMPLIGIVALAGETAMELRDAVEVP
jgi:protein involved in polysaccharide export with SLBB domain